MVEEIRDMAPLGGEELPPLYLLQVRREIETGELEASADWDRIAGAVIGDLEGRVHGREK